jgi:hypothetical protein
MTPHNTHTQNLYTSILAAIMLLAVIALLAGCGQRQVKPYNSGDSLAKINHNNQILSQKRQRLAMDTLLKDLNNTMHQVMLKRKAQDYEILYLRTHKDKYRKLGNLYYDSSYWCWLLYKAAFDSSKVVFKPAFK